MTRQLSKTATMTQFNRIRETIETLKQSEILIRRRKDNENESIKLDNLNHTYEIIWGWEELKKEINNLPESCIDKPVYEEITLSGLQISTNLLHDLKGQYFPDREPHQVNLNIGGAFR
ncbi:hypothetical protein ACFL47_08995 [Candidatus Latescibacterota bacterium]